MVVSPNAESFHPPNEWYPTGIQKIISTRRRPAGRFCQFKRLLKLLFCPEERHFNIFSHILVKRKLFYFAFFRHVIQADKALQPRFRVRMRPGILVHPFDKVLKIQIMPVCRISVRKLKKRLIPFCVFIFKQLIKHFVSQFAFRLVSHPKTGVKINHIIIFFKHLQTERVKRRNARPI